MTDTFDPGEGWEPVHLAPGVRLPRHSIAYCTIDGQTIYWRKNPTPESYTPSPEAKALFETVAYPTTNPKWLRPIDQALEAARQQGRDEEANLRTFDDDDEQVGAGERWIIDAKKNSQGAGPTSPPSKQEGGRVVTPSPPGSGGDGSTVASLKTSIILMKRSAVRPTRYQPEGADGLAVNLSLDLIEDMGDPSHITVTIEPGDLLNVSTEPEAVPEAPDLGPNAMPDRIIIDGKGYGWREWDAHPEMWSMVPQNPDNSPVPTPLTYFVKEAIPEGKVLVERELVERAAEILMNSLIHSTLADRLRAALGEPV